MEPQLKANLAACAAEFARVRGVAMSTVGRLAAGDWHFFERIEGDASFTARKYDQIIGWFSQNWPEGAVWPEGVERPEVAAS